MIRLLSASHPEPSMSVPPMPVPPNALRGEFSTPVGGSPARFDTTLGTVALIEDHCGGRSILEVVNAAVTGRRAADQMSLLAGALRAGGHPPDEAEARAARATVPEAEAFILALMGALGFTLTPHPGEERDPLDGPPAGGAGAPSRSGA